MLSATPVNNRFNDLKNQLALAYEGETKNINDKLAILSASLKIMVYMYPVTFCQLSLHLV